MSQVQEDHLFYSKKIEIEVFHNSIFQSSLSDNNIKVYSRNTSSGVAFAGRFIRSIRELPKRPVFEKCESNSLDILQTKTKQCNNRAHSSTKSTPIQASLKKNGGFVHKILVDKRKNIDPKFQVNNLVRFADLRKSSSKGDTTNCSYIFCKISEIVNDTIPSYRLDNLPERYNKAFLRRTELTMKENRAFKKTLNLNWIKKSLAMRAHPYYFFVISEA